MGMKGYYISIKNDLLEPKHVVSIGTAIWEFMWLLDKMTDTIDGKVLGGKPINLQDLADDLGVTDRTISTNLHRLEDCGYIKIIRTPRGLSVRINKPKKMFKSDRKKSSPDKKETSDVKDQKRTSDAYIDNTVKDNTKTLYIAEQSSAEINPLISLFKSINPNYDRLFSNKTERAALSRLVKKHGKEKIENTIKALPKMISKPYAPRITTPYQLEKKLGDLIAFYKQSESKLEKLKIGSV